MLGEGGSTAPENAGGGGIFHVHPSRLVLGCTQPPVQWVLGLIFSGRVTGMALASHHHLARVELHLYFPSRVNFTNSIIPER